MNKFFRMLIAVLLCLASSVSYAQEVEHWSNLMDDPSVNFYEIQDQFNTYWADKEIIRGQGYKQFKRWEWFMEPRVYPSGERIDPMQTWNEIEEVRRNNPSFGSRSGLWTYFGNTSVPGSGGGAGRINNVRSLPGDNNTWFACAPAGGLWKTTNAGTSWQLMNTDLLASIGVSDVAIDPNNTDIIYIATGDGDAGDTYSVGVLKSTDGGATWNSTGLNWNQTQTLRISRLIMDPGNSSILIAATSNGIYRTINAGGTWTQIISGNFKDIKFNPGNSNTVYATVAGSSFYRSTDNGASFNQVTSGLPSSGVNRMAIGVSAANSAYVYLLAGSSSNSGFYALYRSTDNGQTFTQRANSPNLLGWDSSGNDSGGQSWYDLACAVDPNNANVVYVGGVNVWKSVDGGTNWDCVGHWYGQGGLPYVHADIHGLTFIPGTSTLLVGCDGGVFRTTNGGSTFSDHSSNMEIAQIYRLGVAQTNVNRVITGWQDNGTNLKNSTTWNRVIGGDGMECIISHSDQNEMYGTIYYGQIFKSTNGGGGFSTIVGSGGTGVNEQGAWVTPYVMDPLNDNNLWVGKSTVYHSTDAGNSWTAAGTIAGGNITALAVAQSNSNYIYASKGSSLYGSTDGTNFTQLTGLPNQYITYIAVDPTDEQRVWVTLSGYNASNKIFYSANAGSTWTNISTGLPNLPANCVVYAPGTDDGLYVGTDAGVYYKDNTFAAWQPYLDGLPLVPISELEIHFSSNTIVAATYGRGVWHAPLFTLPGLDAAISQISSPYGTECDTEVTPVVAISNYGSDDLTSVAFDYGVTGGTNYTYTWTGTLATGELTNVTLPAFDPGAGSLEFYATITDVNAQGADDNAGNNQMLNQYYATGGTNFLDLSLLTDCYASETSYTLSDDQGNIIYSGSGYVNSTNYTVPLCLADGCYSFTIYDSYGDGIAGSLYGCNDGDYSITDDLGNVLVDMDVANFGSSATHEFCVPFLVIPGCMDPAADNYDPTANQDDGSCTYSCTPVTITLLTDCWGGETSWSLEDDLGNVIDEVAAGTLGNQTSYDYDFCLDDGCYTFFINDTYGDGLNGTAFGCAIDGNYQIVDGDGNILVQMAVADFDFGTSHTFCVSSGAIEGCTDPTACNYNSDATQDDGSCQLPDGCTDPVACNYDPAATCDDGSCILPDGCTNPTACNYDPTAQCDNGTCVLPDGCTDPAACNFDPAATCDDGSCILPDGCTDPTACNYDPTAQCDNGTCVLPDGCTDSSACNYDPSATCDDGTCILPDGCTDPTACNYDPTAQCDNGSCIMPDGCTDPTACNFDPAATCDDGSCILPDGCTDSGACNYDPAAVCDDGSCELPDGCTDPTACNYDPAANCDNGTCTYASTWYQDNDGDGHGSDITMEACTQPPGYVAINGDCDDNLNTVYPGAAPTGEGHDNNCDGFVDQDEAAPCFADFNNDGERNVADLLYILGNMGCSGVCDADLNGDGVVNTGDMVNFLGIYGVPCP